MGFDGHLNTGLTLRTVRVKDGMAEVGGVLCCAMLCCAVVRRGKGAWRGSQAAAIKSQRPKNITLLYTCVAPFDDV